MSPNDLSGFSMLDLFRLEAETQSQVLIAALLALERSPTEAHQLELCMRAAHSLKGAARIVGLDQGVRVAHAMEDCLVAAQEGRLTLTNVHIDALLRGMDLLMRLANPPEDATVEGEAHTALEIDEYLALLARTLDAPVEPVGSLPAVSTPVAATPAVLAAPIATSPLQEPAVPPESRPSTSAQGGMSIVEGRIPSPESRTPSPESAIPRVDRRAPSTESRESDRVLRVTAENLNTLLGLASESLVESRWVKSFTDSLLRLKRMHNDSCNTLDALREGLSAQPLDDETQDALARVQRVASECRDFVSQRLVELEMFDRRSLNLSHRLYDEALACRMRPFSDGVQGYPRMVRDIAQSLGKRVKLEIVGESTQVDRDILVKLDAPLGHLLRNAIDHGIESPDERVAAGKPAEGVVRLEARHSAGALHIILSDDGRGVDLEKAREVVVSRNLITREAVDALSESELLEFLFLPGFTVKDTITDISGRGVGLDVVQDMVKQVRGAVRVSSQDGKGTRFLLQLPVTLSVVRTLLAEIGGEPYAFPLAHIVRTLKLTKDKIELLEGREHFELDGRRIGLVAAHQALGLDATVTAGDELPVIVVGDHSHSYGLIVDRFLGEGELVVKPLDPLLGRVPDIAAGALMEDGSPVLIVNADDLIRSVDRLVAGGRPGRISRGPAVREPTRKRVLVVDDSLTVRELERKLLGSQGYEVAVAVDGMDGWNAVRTGNFDLVVTDIDMPRMDGIELVTLINADTSLKKMPVIVVSYKDREEDRRRGLDAGAAYYLTKGSFENDALLQAVVDLIGEAHV